MQRSRDYCLLAARFRSISHAKKGSRFGEEEISQQLNFLNFLSQRANIQRRVFEKTLQWSMKFAVTIIKKRAFYLRDPGNAKE